MVDESWPRHHRELEGRVGRVVDVARIIPEYSHRGHVYRCRGQQHRC